MSVVQIFFIVIFGVGAACILHNFVYIRHMATAEFLAKFLGGALGALLGPIVLGHWWMAIEDVWFVPEIVGALIGAAFVAVVWKVLAHRGLLHVQHVEPKPVTH